MSRFLSPTLEAVTPYTPGEQPQDQQYIKLNTNESPYLPSPAVVGAVSEAEVEKLRLYSDPACAELLRAAAAHFDLQPEQIMPGNGSDENLFFALRAFCDENHPLAYADITYGCYGVWCGLMHIPSHIIPLKEDFTLDPADYYGLNETIVIANPNAPTGLAQPRSAIEEILKSNPNHVVIVDEAYVDFGGESCVPLINEYENLLVVQTFSKSRQLAGKITGAHKGIDKGRQVYAFGAGTKKLYDYLNNNPECMSAPVDYTNDIRSISALDNFMSINNAVDVDLFGQVNAESAGVKHISGAGGQLDFVLGAYLSKGGKSFICCSSTFKTKDGQLKSRILPTLNQGSIVTDTRANIHYLVTEYGKVNLKGLSTWEKCAAIISVAHPDFRDQLIADAEKMNIWRRSNKR